MRVCLQCKLCMCIFVCLVRKGPNRDPKLWFLFINVWPNVVPCTTHTHTQYNNVDKKRPLPNTSPTQHKTDKTKFAFGCFSSLFPLHPYIFALLFSLGDVGNVWCFVCTHSPGVFQYKSYCCLRDKIMWLFTKAYSQHNWFSLPHTPIWKVRSDGDAEKKCGTKCAIRYHINIIYIGFFVLNLLKWKNEKHEECHTVSSNMMKQANTIHVDAKERFILNVENLVLWCCSFFVCMLCCMREKRVEGREKTTHILCKAYVKLCKPINIWLLAVVDKRTCRKLP